MTVVPGTQGRLKKLWGHSRLRLLFWVTLAGLVFGALELGAPLDDNLRALRNHARHSQATGDIVLVAYDDRSLDAVDKWPWPRRHQGQLVDNLRTLGVARVFFDIDFSSTTEPADDGALDAALDRMGGRATLALRFVIDPVTGERTDNFPAARFRDSAKLANINVPYTVQGVVWKIPYALSYGGKAYPSFASSLARASGDTGEMFTIDYSIDPRSIRVVSAADVIAGRVPASVFRGKDVVIGTTSLQLGDIYFVPGRGRMPGVYLHILAAETLKAGRPADLGWFLPLAFAIAVAGSCLFSRRSRYAVALWTGAVAALLFAPIALEAHSLNPEIVPALFLLIVAGVAQAWQAFRRSYRDRSRINAATGLPNLSALREDESAGTQIMVAARVQNYAQICAALPAADERTLVEQIVSRLTVGASALTLYQGDEGIFAWLADREIEPQLEAHLSALHGLFRSPVTVNGNRFDLAITFGVETGSGRSPASRLGGALVAADEAARESLRWKRYDPAEPEAAKWKLSILSQLDSAIDAGDLWVAYQPKFDLADRSIVGAEALVRWTHPQKGPISPMEFVPAAEQNGRIEKLTEFVLERAIRAAALLNRRGIDFNISVNLSPKLLGRFPLEAIVVDLLTRFGLSGHHLTLEVTETAALATGAADLGALHNLRERGVRISIDDYGTGLSTLDYVKRIPATEIKVDKSFVQSIGKSNSDKLMVNSTIQLAHSLGQKVVAEGVEDLSTLETLAAMGCDIAQGFYLAKPMTFKELMRLLVNGGVSRAA
ncbi:MAG TPA: EAL domain-containing protein [Allosphingosinicella sp.]